ncbi:MAG: AraC family transcriptional regulator [Allosphingosinicella sp.]
MRAVSLTNYAEVARFVGLDPAAMLRRADIDPAELADPEHLLDAGRVSALLEASARASSCPVFGLLMAESRSVASVGAIGLLLKHQGTAREVIEAVVQYQSLLTQVIAISTEDMEGATVVRTELSAGIGGPQSTEYLMGLFCRIVSELTGGRWHPESAHFLHDPPADLAVHRRIFQCALVFRSDFNGFVCSTGSLDAPNPAADSIMARHARRYLDMLVPDPADGSITERARRCIYLLLPAGRATLEQVGANMGLSARTLQRSLEKEGRTFATLLNEVRRELALRYLASSTHSVTAIAQMTGYATPSSFTRWFAAEFGVAPAAWRAEERREIDLKPSPRRKPGPRGGKNGSAFRWGDDTD